MNSSFVSVIFACCFFLFTYSNTVAAQDTLRLNLRTADSLFQTRSYYLLAAQMNIEAQKAQIIQSKLYPNPVATVELNAYDPTSGKYFNIGSEGEKIAQVEQLILLGGKRKTQIEMAKTNAAIAEIEFTQLVRQLKYTLHTELFSIAQYQRSINTYKIQLLLLDTIITSYEKQATKGNLPLKDVVRLKGTYMTLNHALSDMLLDYYQSMANLQTILQTSSTIVFNFTDNDINNYVKALVLEELLLTAKQYNPQLQMMVNNKTLANQYLQYQKSMAIPDINLYSAYDQRGGAFNNQINGGLALSLPFWNRNQGNIKMAQYQLKGAEYSWKALEAEITSKIINQYQLYNLSVTQYLKATTLYNNDFEITMKGMSDNFQKRNVSLIEFVDFFEAYSTVLSEMARINIQLVQNAEELNNLIGKDLF